MSIMTRRARGASRLMGKHVVLRINLFDLRLWSYTDMTIAVDGH